MVYNTFTYVLQKECSQIALNVNLAVVIKSPCNRSKPVVHDSDKSELCLAWLSRENMSLTKTCNTSNSKSLCLPAMRCSLEPDWIKLEWKCFLDK